MTRLRWLREWQAALDGEGRPTPVPVNKAREQAVEDQRRLAEMLGPSKRRGR